MHFEIKLPCLDRMNVLQGRGLMVSWLEETGTVPLCCDQQLEGLALAACMIIFEI